jgi:serine/threonine protein kinase
MNNSASRVNASSNRPRPAAGAEQPGIESRKPKPMQRCAATDSLVNLPRTDRCSSGPAAQQQIINLPALGARLKPSASCGALTDITDIIGKEDDYVPDPVPESVDMTTLRIGDEFSRGYNASIHEAKVLEKGKVLEKIKWIDCAVKRALEFSDNPKNPMGIIPVEEKDKAEAKSNLEHEFATQNSLRHYNIMPCYGFSEKEVAIAMPKAQASLRTVLEKIKALPDTRRAAIQKTILQQTVNGLMHIYRRRVAHPDLHLNNFLYMQGRVCVADFGLASVVPKGQYSMTNAKNFELKFYVNTFRQLANFIYLNSESDIDETAIISDENLDLIKILAYLTEEEIKCAKNNDVFPIEDQRHVRDTLIDLHKNFQTLEGCLSKEELAAELNTVL